ncbi:MAG: hypothetical protein Q8N56_03065 [bacterium]|nr:hypothetical protein [bacterium]
MPEFYHDLITEKSLEILQSLRRKLDFILIGGWAVFLYTKALKSKDIDIILDYGELAKIKNDFGISKNERLKKYETNIDETSIDIYLPHFSEIGFPLEDIKSYCRSSEGFIVPIPEVMLIFKTHVLKERSGTTKGRKDLLDIFSLLDKTEINWKVYRSLIKKYGLEKLREGLREIIQHQSSLAEIGLTNHKIAKLKKKVLAII